MAEFRQEFLIKVTQHNGRSVWHDFHRFADAQEAVEEFKRVQRSLVGEGDRFIAVRSDAAETTYSVDDIAAVAVYARQGADEGGRTMRIATPDLAGQFVPGIDAVRKMSGYRVKVGHDITPAKDSLIRCDCGHCGGAVIGVA